MSTLGINFANTTELGYLDDALQTWLGEHTEEDDDMRAVIERVQGQVERAWYKETEKEKR